MKIWRDDVDFNNYDEKYTSADWFDLTSGDFIIMDADGWNRQNYQYSFYEELITKEEFEKRLLTSTIYFK